MADELHRVEFRGNLYGQYRENVMHWRITAPTSTAAFANSNALALFMNSSIKGLFLQTLPADYTLDAIFVRRIGPTGGPYASVDYAPLANTGSRGGESVSEQLCPCVTLIPPLGVKSAGRIFLPAVEKADVNLNVFAAGYVTAVQNLINACIAGGTVAGGLATLVIYSRKLNTNNTVADFHLSSVIGYQRRRSKPIGA